MDMVLSQRGAQKLFVKNQGTAINAQVNAANIGYHTQKL